MGQSRFFKSNHASSCQVGRRGFLKMCGYVSAGLAISSKVAALPRAAANRPNIILICGDDVSKNWLGCYGGKGSTPNLDSLAADGAKFNRFYVSSAVCCPSRFSLLSGKYASRSATYMNKKPSGSYANLGWESRVSAEKHTLQSVLSASGYATGMVGKWHQGNRAIEKFTADEPIDEAKVTRNYTVAINDIKGSGFSFAAGAYWSNLVEDYLPVPWQVHNQEWVTDNALKFIEQNKDAPFFLYVASTVPHGPDNIESLQADPRITTSGLLDTVPNVQPSRQSAIDRAEAQGVKYRAGLTWFDDGVGAVLNKLKELNLENDTIIIFVSDNGYHDGKNTCYDAGACLPAMIKWPGKIAPGTVYSELCSNIDFVPTIFDICGISTPPDMEIDGVSILPLLQNTGLYSRPSLFLEMQCERAVVTDDNFKYLAVRYAPEIQSEIDNAGAVYYHTGKTTPVSTYDAAKNYPSYFDQDQLYDLTSDPNEQKNVFNVESNAAKIQEMKSLLREYSLKLPHLFGEFTNATGSVSPAFSARPPRAGQMTHARFLANGQVLPTMSSREFSGSGIYLSKTNHRLSEQFLKR